MNYRLRKNYSKFDEDITRYHTFARSLQDTRCNSWTQTLSVLFPFSLTRPPWVARCTYVHVFFCMLPAHVLAAHRVYVGYASVLVLRTQLSNEHTRVRQKDTRMGGTAR